MPRACADAESRASLRTIIQISSRRRSPSKILPPTGSPVGTRDRVPAGHRRIIALGRLAAALVLVAVIVAVVQLWEVRTDAEHARSLFDSVVSQPESFRTAPGRAAAQAKIHSGTVLLERAHTRVTGSPLLSAAGHLPGLSGQRKALLRLVDDAHTGSVTLAGVVDEVDTLSSAAHISNGRVPYPTLARLETTVRAAAQTVRSLDQPHSIPMGPLGDTRRQFNALARKGADRLDLAVEEVGTARAFTGEGGDRRYLVAVQNNAEMRDQGMVLSYALAEFTDGSLRFGTHGSVEELRLDRPTSTPVPPGTDQVFGSLFPTQTWQSVNASADFALSGQAMADMYRQATGGSIDGVVAIDVPALAAILRAVGPVTVEGEADPVNADNVGTKLLHDLYQGIGVGGDRTQLRRREANITTAIIGRLTTADYGIVALAEELGGAGGGGHIHLWSSAPAEEQAFEHMGIGGGPATSSPDRTFHLAVENRSATKLDYYVKPRVRQRITVTRSGTAVVQTTVEIDNQAPVGAASSYQLGPDATIRNPGDYLAWLLLWGPQGSTQPGGVPESGLVLSQHVVDVAAGGHRALTFPDTVIPGAVRNGHLDLRLVPQARLDPMPLEVTLTAEGWDVEGALNWSGPWDRVVHLSWNLHR